MDNTNVVLQVTWYRDEQGNLLRDIFGGGIEQTAIGGLVSQLFFDVHAKGALGQSSHAGPATQARPLENEKGLGDIVPIIPEAMQTDIEKDLLNGEKDLSNGDEAEAAKDLLQKEFPATEGPKDDPVEETPPDY